MSKSHILGFPRVGENREFKKALEAYWRLEISQAQLQQIGHLIKVQNWQLQKEAGLDFITVGDFSWYDHVLDTSALLGVCPPRFTDSHESTSIDLDTIFCMSRGSAPHKLKTDACAMKKWFNTNYHYIVPELSKTQTFKLSTDTLFNEIEEAQKQGHAVKPVLLGPLSFLALSKAEGDFNKLDLLNQLIPVYNEILAQFKAKNINWVQIDEPILVLDLEKDYLDAFISTYQQLDFSSLHILLATYFGDVSSYIETIKQLNVHGLHIDLASAPQQLEPITAAWPKDKVLSLGLINGRNVWCNDLENSSRLIEPVKAIFKDNLWIASSCSLLHVPVNLENEKAIDPELKSTLAFAKQKLKEITVLCKVANGKQDEVASCLALNKAAINIRKNSRTIHNAAVQKRLKEVTEKSAKRNSHFKERSVIQKRALNLPLMPTTTIGSFPQTAEIRKIRQEYKKKKIDEATYIDLIQQEIKAVIHLQEEIGLDVLVHGEAERNDMVEYFGELLEGFLFTTNGWVQSYGSRCVKPPIIYADVSRKAPMTVAWSCYAQSLTDRPVKGMLTGPITILAWSFVRDDQTLARTALQIALALKDEVKDLEAAGINIIQIDEPAFREALPLKKKDWQAYLDWASFSFALHQVG